MRAKGFASIYLLLDFLTALAVWWLFYGYRKVFIEKMPFTADDQFWLGLLFVPLFWVIFYTFFGSYIDVLRKHRIKVLGQTALQSLLGVTIVFFALLLDDSVYSYKQYYKLFFTLLGLHFFITLIPRMLITTIIVNAVHRKKLGFKTLIVGGSEKALEIYQEIQNIPKGNGYDFIGFISINGIDRQLSQLVDHLGEIDQLEKAIEDNNIQEVIIAIESSEHENLKAILNRLSHFNIKIKILPDSYDLIAGAVKMTNIFGAILIELRNEEMPPWQRSVKRMIDILISVIALIILLPLFIVIAIAVKATSKGPVFFKQERIGKNQKPFQIIKFRTMVVDAEKSGPQLSSSGDQRITSIGKFLRKTRLDEFPQFWNVIKGDMSLVGPRPERQFFIDKILPLEPQYRYLHKVRPGITSWGQVKFGYAENVDQMVQRMKYDLLYMKNMSIALDIKIMFYTVAIIFKGKGK